MLKLYGERFMWVLISSNGSSRRRKGMGHFGQFEFRFGRIRFVEMARELSLIFSALFIRCISSKM